MNINGNDNHFLVVTRKIFKLRYSSSKLFKYIDKYCWTLGIDSPILITYDIVARLTNLRNDISEDNEEELLHTTISNLLMYHPTKFNKINVNISSDQNTQPLLPTIVISKLDESISEVQQKLFNTDAIMHSNV